MFPGETQHCYLPEDDVQKAYDFNRNMTKTFGVCGVKRSLAFPSYAPPAWKDNKKIKQVRNQPMPCFGNMAELDPANGKRSAVKATRIEAVENSRDKKRYDFFMTTVHGRAFSGKECEMDFGVRYGTCKDCCSCKEGLVKYETYTSLHKDKYEGCEVWYLRSVGAMSDFFGLVVRQKAMLKQYGECKNALLSCVGPAQQPDLPENDATESQDATGQVEEEEEEEEEECESEECPAPPPAVEKSTGGVWKDYLVKSYKALSYGARVSTNSKKGECSGAAYYFDKSQIGLFNALWKPYFRGNDGQLTGSITGLTGNRRATVSNSRTRNTARSASVKMKKSVEDGKKYALFYLTFFGKSEGENPECCQVQVGVRAGQCKDCCSCKKGLVKYETDTIVNGQSSEGCSKWFMRAVSFAGSFFNILERLPLLMTFSFRCSKPGTCTSHDKPWPSKLSTNVTAKLSTAANSTAANKNRRRKNGGNCKQGIPKSQIHADQAANDAVCSAKKKAETRKGKMGNL